MAIALEALNLIVPVHIIDQKYPGGWEQCRKDHSLEAHPSSFGACWHDGLLFRDGAMSPFDMTLLTDRWEAYGFKATRRKNGRPVAGDFCVYSLLSEARHPCDWLSIDASTATASFRGPARVRNNQCGRLLDMSMDQVMNELSLVATRIGESTPGSLRD